MAITKEEFSQQIIDALQAVDAEGEQYKSFVLIAYGKNDNQRVVFHQMTGMEIIQAIGELAATLNEGPSND